MRSPRLILQTRERVWASDPVNRTEVSMPMAGTKNLSSIIVTFGIICRSYSSEFTDLFGKCESVYPARLGSMPMYNEYWGFKRSPFSGSLDPERFYESPSHKEALARLSYVVDECRQGALVLGPAGGGKNPVVGAVCRRNRRRD